MNLDHGFFQVSKLSEDQKKVFAKNGTLFSPNLSEDLCLIAHQSQIIRGDADENHTEIFGGIQSNYWGDISPHPPGFRHPCPQSYLFLTYSIIVKTDYAFDGKIESQALLPWRNDAEMGPANVSHTSTYYSEFNERFDLEFTGVVIKK